MIGSQAAVADSRRTAPPATAPARVAGQVIRDADERPPDDGRRPRHGSRPAPAPTRARGGRRARAPRRGGGTGRPPGTASAARPGPARGPRSRSCTTRIPGFACLEPRELPLPADDLLLRGLADRAGVDHDRGPPPRAPAPRRSPRRAAGRPSPRSRCGSSGSRASTRGSAGSARGLGPVLVEARRRPRASGAAAAAARPGPFEHRQRRWSSEASSPQASVGERPRARSQPTRSRRTFSVACASAYGIEVAMVVGAARGEQSERRGDGADHRRPSRRWNVR